MQTAPQEPENESFDWDELIAFIRDRKVVPIIGRELLQMAATAPGPLLEHHLAQQLAAELKVDLALIPQPASLHQVAFQYLEQRKPSNKIYSKLKTLLDRVQIEPPEPLRQLASITDFDLFITTTFDSLLENAINTARFGARADTLSYAFSPLQTTVDLPLEGLPPGGAAVYHVFGKASLFPDFAVTEADILEFMHAMQSDIRQPKRLFDVLRERHLLFLGCGFPDWLARFFIRTLKAEPFSAVRRRNEIVVDHQLGAERDLVIFLKHFDTQVPHFGGAVRFVAELYRRWSQVVSPEQPPRPPRPSMRRMPDGAVFLSYARENLPAVHRIRDALEAAGIDVWLDTEDLQMGADVDSSINERILRCSLFLPFISCETEAAHEGYFHAEWNLAIQRSHRIARTVPFIIPVALDDTVVHAPNVPPEFRQRNWVRLPDGQPTPEFIDSIRRMVRQLRAPQY